MLFIKTIHMICALVSIGGFFARGVLMIKDSPLLQARWLRIMPHVNDTVLLVAGITLATQWGMAALQLPWLWAKIIALLLYIYLGMLALHPGRAKSRRISAWVAALVVFAYIVTVAVTRNPLVFI